MGLVQFFLFDFWDFRFLLASRRLNSKFLTLFLSFILLSDYTIFFNGLFFNFQIPTMLLVWGLIATYAARILLGGWCQDGVTVLDLRPVKLDCSTTLLTTDFQR